MLGLTAESLAAPGAHAGAVYFAFTHTEPGVSARGILATTLVVPGEYPITGVSGQRNGSPITAFLYPTTEAQGDMVYISNGSGINNLLSPPPLHGPFSNWTGSSGTPSGFVFETEDGQVNPYTTDGNTYEYDLSVGGSGYGIPIHFSAVQEAPEPGPLALVGTGLLALGGLLLLRRSRLEWEPAGSETNNIEVKKMLKGLALRPIG